MKERRERERQTVFGCKARDVKGGKQSEMSTMICYERDSELQTTTERERQEQNLSETQ